MPVVLAALPEIMMGLVLILIIWACKGLFGGLLSSFSSRVPLIGSVFATLASAIFDDTIAAAEQEASTWLPKLLGFMLGPVYWIEHLVADGLDIFYGLAAQIRYVVTVMLPQVAQIALVQAEALVARAEADLENLVNQIYKITQSEFTQVYATIAAVEHALEQYIQADIAAVEAQLTAAIDAETAYVTASISAIETEITSAIGAETAFVEASTASAVAYTQAVATSLSGEITAGDSAIISWVQGEIGSLVSVIDQVQTATVAVALTTAKAVEADLQNLKDDCTDNLCSGAGELASLVNGLLQAGFVAALLGYAGWAATDPRGCGDATATVLVPLATGAKDIVDAAAGAL